MQNEESMDALSEVLKDLVQEPIKSIYQDSISDDIEKVKVRLKRVGAISDQVNSVQQDIEDKHDDIENLLNRIMDRLNSNESVLVGVTDSLKGISVRLSGVADDTLKGNQNIITRIEEKNEVLNKESKERCNEVKSLLIGLIKDNSGLKADSEKRELRELELTRAIECHFFEVAFEDD